MTLDDISDVHKIEKECFSSPWSEKSLKNELDKPRCDFFVLEFNGTICGYIGTNIILDECYIANVGIKSEFRRRGFAKALVSHAINNAIFNSCSMISLEVRKSNFAAIDLYSYFAFEPVGERKRFYTDPDEDAIIMTKVLK